MRPGALRRPEYTGSNRCWPCTVLNAAIVGVVALVLARRDRRLLAAVAALAGAGAVALRGYVIPYTPVVAPRLVAALPLPDSVLGKPADSEIPESVSLTGADLDGERVLATLADAGAIEADGELIRPTAPVDAAWNDEMDRLATVSPETLAREASETLPTVADATAYENETGQWLAVDGTLVAQPVAVAELAAYRVLGDTVTDDRARLAGASAFRMFLDRCPVCDATIVESSEASCCGGYTDPRTTPDDVLVCPTCEQRVYTFPN